MSDHFDKRRKLNMIKPGIVMLGINFLLTVCGAIANLLNWNTVSIIAYALSAFLMLALIILPLIEQHQNRALNEQETSEQFTQPESIEDTCLLRRAVSGLPRIRAQSGIH